MAELTFTERQAVEKAFDMSSGYVLNFSNRTFQEFIHDSIGRNIYDQKYSTGGDSKANRLRTLIKVEPNHVVGKVIADLVEVANSNPSSRYADPGVLAPCSRLADRLRQGAPVLEEVLPDEQETTFDALSRSVRQAIESNEPEAGLDRLHTYFVTFMRRVCENNAITTSRDEPAHSVLGKYVKMLKSTGRIESEMTGRILTYAQSTMDAFNRVRNEQSLAHPNPILNYNEALLIFNHVVAAVNFIESVERKASAPATSVVVGSASGLKS